MNPAEIVLNGSLLLAIPLAFAAGLISFLSPCVLPLVPGYLGYVSANAVSGSADAPVAGSASQAGATKAGLAARPKSRLIAGASLFVLGFTVVFVSLGVLAGAASLIFLTRNTWVQLVLGALVALFGLAMMGQFGWLQRTVKLPYSPKLGLAGAPLLGVVFAIGWTPCIGPTLAAVLVLASDSGDPLRGGLLATVYSLGLGLPFIAIAAGFGWATRSVTWVRKHIRAVNIFGGLLLVLIGLALMTGLWNQFVNWVQVMTSGFQLQL
jgi:cytochrome c-type biogenesis protein